MRISSSEAGARRGRKSRTSPSTTRTFGTARFEHRGEPGGVHLDADDALVRASTAQFDQRLAGAEADVEHERPVAAELRRQRQRRAVDGQTEAVHGRGERRSPSRRQPATRRGLNVRDVNG